MLDDVVVIGAGPAGLAAALVLARARRRVTVVDGGPGRSAAAARSHGLLGRDGVPVAELWADARAQLARYPEVRVVAGRASSLERDPEGVAVPLEGEVVRARRALLATGMIDVLPKIEGLRARWGKSVMSCAYCHGYELAGRPWALLAESDAALASAFVLRSWSEALTLLLAPGVRLEDARRAQLERDGFVIEPRALVALHGEGSALSELELEGGARVPCEALVVRPKERQADIVLYAGLALETNGRIRVDAEHRTSMENVHACGECASPAPQIVHALSDATHAAKSVAASLLGA